MHDPCGGIAISIQKRRSSESDLSCQYDSVGSAVPPCRFPLRRRMRDRSKIREGRGPLDRKKFRPAFLGVGVSQQTDYRSERRHGLHLSQVPDAGFQPDLCDCPPILQLWRVQLHQHIHRLQHPETHLHDLVRDRSKKQNGQESRLQGGSLCGGRTWKRGSDPAHPIFAKKMTRITPNPVSETCNIAWNGLA